MRGLPFLPHLTGLTVQPLRVALPPGRQLRLLAGGLARKDQG